MKPKIQLVGGKNASRSNEASYKCAPESNNDSNMFAALSDGKAAALLEECLKTIIKAMDASAGIVRLLSPDGKQLSLIGKSGLFAEFCEYGSAIDASCGVCGKSAAAGKIETSDADFCASRYGAGFFAENCKFVLAVPLQQSGKAGEMSGVVTLFFASAQSVTAELERTLGAYAELMRIALLSVWQNEDTYQVNLLKERQSIANEIHDSLAQTLYFAKIRASLLTDALKTDNDMLAFRCAQDIDEALENSQKTVRELVTHFRCQMDPRGLEFALKKLVKDFAARSSIKLEYNNQVENLALPPEYELQIFLIMREALVNVATHSGANDARLHITCSGGRYTFTVEDNGSSKGGAVSTEGHYGLVIMRERALRIGGVMEVESPEGLGTRVQLVIGTPAV